MDIDQPVLNHHLLKELKVAWEHGAIFLKIDPDIIKDNTQYSNILRECGFKKTKPVLILKEYNLALSFVWISPQRNKTIRKYA